MAEKINISIEDGELIITGSIDFGYIGTFTDEEIEILDALEEIREWDIVEDNLDEDCTDEELIAFLNKYFNDFAKKIEKNIENINNTFLLHVFSGMADCGLEFWEIEDLYIEDKDPYGDTEEIYDAVADKLDELCEHLETPNDGSVKKPKIEQTLKKMFPMFDFDNAIRLCNGHCEYISNAFNRR